MTVGPATRRRRLRAQLDPKLRLVGFFLHAVATLMFVGWFLSASANMSVSIELTVPGDPDDVVDNDGV